MGELLSFSLVSLSAVFVVVDPIAAIPFFLSLTAGDDAVRRRHVARRAVIAAYLVLTFFALAGAVLFELLGITLGAFKMAGGILLLLTAVDMLRTRAPETRITAEEVEAGSGKPDVAIVPLAIPLLAGPGSIATVVVLMGRARGGDRWWTVLPVLGAIAATALAAYVLLAFAAGVHRVLGRTGLSIIERVAGLLLAAIALQFLVDGLADVLPTVLRRV